MDPQPIKGLHQLPDFISAFQEQTIIEQILSSEWNTTLKRRTQHYGYEYSYDRKSTAKKTVDLPDWCIPVKKQLENYLNKGKNEEDEKIVFDQMIVNEYEPGQGINPHIDNTNLFRDTIVSVSLGSPTIMIFQREKEKREFILTRRVALIMEGQARYEWKHSIPGRKKDNGVARGKRFSLTFRQMK